MCIINTSRRCVNLATAILNYLKWRYRFNGFGWKSRIGSVDLLYNSKQIYIGKNVQIRKGSRIEVVTKFGKSPKIKIGDDTSIQMYFHCGAMESVEIGKSVLIAGRVYISDHDHVFNHPSLPPRHCENLIAKPVVVGDGVWLGEGVVVLKGVTIGERSVIGANSVVTKDIPPYSIAAGVPAKVIRSIEFREGTQEL